MSLNPETHSCPTCGYTWRHGQHGGHNCADLLLKTIKRLEDELARRSDAGRVEVPELEERDLPYPGKVHPGSYSWQRNKLFAEGYNLARHRSRLSPSPQPSADVVVVLDRVAACARDFQDRQRNLTVSRDSWGFFQSDSALESALKALDALRSSTNHDSKDTP